MIDAGPSLQAAKGLSSTALLTYLVKRGWSIRPSRIDGLSIVSKSVAGSEQPAEFILPVRRGLDDEHRRVADALRTVGAIEGRSEKNIADEIRVSERAPKRKTQKTKSSVDPSDVSQSELFTNFFVNRREELQKARDPGAGVYRLYWYAPSKERDPLVVSAIMYVSYFEKNTSAFQISYRDLSRKEHEVRGSAFEVSGFLYFLGREVAHPNFFFMASRSRNMKVPESSGLMVRSIQSGNISAIRVGIKKLVGRLSSTQDLDAIMGIARESELREELGEVRDKLREPISEYLSAIRQLLTKL